MQVDITIDDKEVTALLQELANNKPKLQGVMRVCGLVMKREVERNFDAQGRPEKWKPLAASTIERRRKKGHWPGRILQDSGQLAASITMQATQTQAVVGTNKVYAAIHQFGGVIHRGMTTAVLHFRKYKSGKHKGKTLFAQARKATYGMKVTKASHSITIPARPFMVLTDKGLAEIAKKAKQALWGGKKGVSP